jgi:hypothetical protein
MAYIDGNEFLTTCIHFTSNTKLNLFLLSAARQLPVRPAFAMTMHKSQGQALDYVGFNGNGNVLPMPNYAPLYLVLPIPPVASLPSLHHFPFTAKNAVYHSDLI